MPVTRSTFHLFFGIEMCFLSTVAWHGDFVFTLKSKKIGTPCTHLEEQTGPAPNSSKQTGQSSSTSGGKKGGTKTSSDFLKVTQESVAGQG